MKVAYIDAFSGVAGDMLLAGLLDAGAPLDLVLEGLRSIKAIEGEWNLQVNRVVKGHGAIAATHVQVISKYKHRAAPPPQQSPQQVPPGEQGIDAHSHDHSHSSHTHTHSHEHGPSHSHSHEHGHSHDQDEPLRNLKSISSMLRESGLPEVVKEQSIAVFTALADAEAKTHGAAVDAVHFHEVGAIDSIIDTVGVVLAFHLLEVEQVMCSKLPFSEGTVWTQHGLLPVPAPATLRLLIGLPVCPGPPSASGELVTPTGASLVRILCSSFGRPPPFVPGAVGIGAGSKDFPKHPNVLRIVIGETCPLGRGSIPSAASQSDANDKWDVENLLILEANVDDMNGEMGSHVVEHLMDLGARDAWTSPATMKKGRPAYTIHALCTENLRDRLTSAIFEESSTIGLRCFHVERAALRRTIITEEIPDLGGAIRFKVAWMEQRPINIKPEFEDCKALARKLCIPLKEAMGAAAAHGEVLRLRLVTS